MTFKEEARTICGEVHEAKEAFAGKCKKFTGAVMVEVVRQHLLNHGLNVSARDVFIKGLPIELDLLVVKPGARAEQGILYNPGDVVAMLEIKSLGSFGPDTVERVKRIFCLTTEHCGVAPVYCAYLTLSERTGYRGMVKPESIDGHDAFTMFWHGSKDVCARDATDDWGKLVVKLKSL